MSKVVVSLENAWKNQGKVFDMNELTKNLLFALIVLTFPSQLLAKGWSSSSSLKSNKETNVKYSVLKFTKGSQSVTFKPSEPPWGLVGVEKVHFKNIGPFFVSTWAQGAKTVLFRVFDPEAKGNIPICSGVSFGETTELRIKDDQLEMALYEEESDDPKWTTCGEKFNRQPNSKKSK